MTLHTRRAGKGAASAALLPALLLAGLLAALLCLAAVTSPPAGAQVVGEAVGPINKATGFPKWYQDSRGLRLGLCLEGPLCLERLPNPRERAFVAAKARNSNFPEEAFWWAGEASIDRPGGGALLVMAREAAFANEVPKRGDQMSFSRVRVRVDGLVAGGRYTVTHPYGTDTYVAEDDGQGGGEINVTEDIGCGVGPLTRCNFAEALEGRVDPFLVWDPAVAPAPPAGYVGDPRREHRVVGSPTGNNFFRVVGPGLGAGGIRTNLFAIQGKKF
jgi:hypothetical protein